jgi:hypothetical protein
MTLQLLHQLSLQSIHYVEMNHLLLQPIVGQHNIHNTYSAALTQCISLVPLSYCAAGKYNYNCITMCVKVYSTIITQHV